MKFKYIQIQLLSFNKFKLWSKHLKFEFSSKMLYIHKAKRKGSELKLINFTLQF